MNKALVFLAATPLVLSPLGLSVAAAQEVDTTGSGLSASGVVGLSETEASTGDGGSAQASTVSAGDQPLLEGTTGAEQQGAGTTSGEVATTGDTPLGEATVGGFEATVTEGEAGTTSTSSASLLEASLADGGVVDVSVLESTSTASDAGGSSTTDGVVIDVGGGDLEVVLLHSETTQDGKGDAFVASVNGTEIAGGDQAEGCVVDADPLAQVACFTAQEGTNTVETEAAVLDVEVVEDRLVVTLGATESGAAEAEPQSDAATSDAALLLLPGGLAVSETESTAGESAEASVVTIGGEPLVGGEQEGTGTTSGALIDTGQTPLGEVAVAPFAATVTEDSASSSSSLLEATLVDDEVLTVDLLSSTSQSNAEGSTSGTQGVVVDLGGGQLEVVLLDSAAGSDGTGSASAATVNGQPVVSSEQAAGCAVDADPAVQALCVTAEKGQTVIETEAAVADVELVDDQLVITLGGAAAQEAVPAPATSSPSPTSGTGGADGGNDGGNDGGSGSGDGDGGNGDGGNGDGGNGDGDAGSGNDGSEGGGGAELADGEPEGGRLPTTGGELTAMLVAATTAVGVGSLVLVAARRRPEGGALV